MGSPSNMGCTRGGARGGALHVGCTPCKATKSGPEQPWAPTSVPSKFWAGPTSPPWPRMVSTLGRGWCPQHPLGQPSSWAMGGEPRGGTPRKRTPSMHHGKALSPFWRWRGVCTVGAHGVILKGYLIPTEIRRLAFSPEPLGFSDI